MTKTNAEIGEKNYFCWVDNVKNVVTTKSYEV